MEHFYNRIPGWFSFRGLYTEMVKQAKDGAHFVEVGSWKGRSAAFMAVEILRSGKDIDFYCVDTWQGSQEPKHLNDPSVRNGTLFKEFIANIAPVREAIEVLQAPSVNAARTFADSSLDFVFIDAAHDYQNVLADITAWWPKVKLDGVVAGDDFLFKGVNQAVKEFFAQPGFFLDAVVMVKGSGTGCQWKVKKLIDRSTVQKFNDGAAAN